MTYDNNLVSIMNDSDVIDYLKKVNEDKTLESDVGYYSNFLDKEEDIKRRVKEMKGSKNFYIARHELRKIYDY